MYTIIPDWSFSRFSVNRKWTDLQKFSGNSKCKTCEKGTRHAVFWSLVVFSNKMSSLCNLTAQMERIQDKIANSMCMVASYIIFASVLWILVVNQYMFIMKFPEGNVYFKTLMLLIKQ